METLEAIFTRRSIREYTAQVVPDELIKQILSAAMQAPSAGNQQPWHFIVVNERTKMDALADVLPFGKMLHTAPLGIAICAGLDLTKHPDFWVQDCSAATQNLLLAAHALGLGAVWLGVYPLEERVAAVKQILGLPAQVIPLCVIPVGYPASQPMPAEKRYNQTRLHYNHW